jgi:hypothetical protein
LTYDLNTQYMDFEHLRDLDERGIFWVTRAKENLDYYVVKSLGSKSEKILKDEVIMLSNPTPRSLREPKENRQIFHVMGTALKTLIRLKTQTK